MFDINIKDLDIQALKDLEAKVSKFHKEIKDKILSRENDFNTWLQYGEKQDYDWVLDRSTLTRQFMMKHMYMERYETVTLNDVLERLEELYETKCITKREVDEIKEDLMDLEFGSMVYDW